MGRCQLVSCVSKPLISWSWHVPFCQGRGPAQISALAGGGLVDLLMSGKILWESWGMGRLQLMLRRMQMAWVGEWWSCWHLATGFPIKFNVGRCQDIIKWRWLCIGLEGIGEGHGESWEFWSGCRVLQWWSYSRHHLHLFHMLGMGWSHLKPALHPRESWNPRTAGPQTKGLAEGWAINMNLHQCLCRRMAFLSGMHHPTQPQVGRLCPLVNRRLPENPPAIVLWFFPLKHSKSWMGFASARFDCMVMLPLVSSRIYSEIPKRWK